MWNLKRNDTNELKKQKETHRPIELMVAGGKRWGIGDQHLYTAIFKMDNQQRPIE